MRVCVICKRFVRLSERALHLATSHPVAASAAQTERHRLEDYFVAASMEERWQS